MRALVFRIAALAAIGSATSIACGSGVDDSAEPVTAADSGVTEHPGDEENDAATTAPDGQSVASKDAGKDSQSAKDASQDADSDDGSSANDGSSDGAVATGDSGPNDAGTADGGPNDATSDATNDGGVAPSTCATPQSPTQMMTLNGAAAFHDTAYPHVAYAGGSIYAMGPFDAWKHWYVWAGVGWSLTSIPWPPSIKKPFPIAIWEQANGHVLMLVNETYADAGYDYFLADFDGTNMTAVPLAKPWAMHVRKATIAADGSYHVLTYAVPGEPMWTSRSGGPAGFGAASPLGIPNSVAPQHVSFTSLTNGRLTLVYSTGHLYEMHRKPNEAWSTALDLTPSWQVGAADPIALGARSGGVAVVVSAISNSYTFPYFWESADGITYSSGEYVNDGTQLGDTAKHLTLDCRGSAVLVIKRNKTKGVHLLRRGTPTAWQTLGAGPSTYSAGGTAAILPNGKTFFGWSYVESDGDAFTNLLATP